jgi:hypothetical protein
VTQFTTLVVAAAVAVLLLAAAAGWSRASRCSPSPASGWRAMSRNSAANIRANIAPS